MHFDPDTSAFTFNYEVNCDIDFPSVGFFSEQFFYESGLTYTLTDSNGTELKQPDDFTADYKDNILTFKVTNKDHNGKTLTLSVSEK